MASSPRTESRTFNFSTFQPLNPVLPIDSHHDELLAAIRDNPVVVVAGDTGSGKTTRIPPLCLELGIPATKLVGCTQPRRVAAVSVAERVALERGTAIGTEIGWQHRFGQALSERTRIKFMTDGILLAETRGDPELRRYAVVMVDEAHERTLNIDFLLGYLKRLLPRRPDLRIVVSSATLDVRRFAEFYRDALPAHGGAAPREVPVVEIPGRVHPVEVRYRPDADEDADLAERVAGGVEELWTSADGDILVFLPGERDIREAQEAVMRLDLPDTDVLPFMASLPPADQRRVFHPLPGRRRVVLSTNVAETSLTIPGIRMVVDSGLARINRYSPRSKVERLHIEPISRASAEQRKGRCGRLGPGICLRLYSEEDFQKRPAYTEPELRRSALDGVILSMADLRLGPVERFPFLDPPGSGAIREGVRTLVELDAIREDGRLTALGRAMVRYPVEPRLARMVLAGHESASEQTLSDVLTIVAALATEDPRLRPLDKKDEADLKHAQFRTKGGDDYDTILRLWRWFHELPSRTAQRRLCKENYLSFRRFQEWEDVRGELARRPFPGLPVRQFAGSPVSKTGKRENRQTGKPENWSPGKSALLRALLTGLLSQIGHRDPEEGDYRGPNGVRFTIHPGSALAKHGPDWIMAAELVDTSRLFARRCAPIDVEWVEPLAGHLCKYSHHSPFWDERVGTARALERVVFRGLTIHDGRRRDYSRIDPDFSREMLVRHGLVQGELPGALPAFVRSNLALFESIRDGHRKLREPEDTDDEAFVALYLERLPQACVNLPALRQWVRHATPEEAKDLLFRREDFAAPEDDPSVFPEKIRLDGHLLRLSYRNEEGAEDDGITCTLDIDAIPSLRRWRSDWLVPGALPGKLDWMLSRLTRAESRPLPPRTELVETLPSLLGTPDRPLEQALRGLLRERWGVAVREGLWDDSALPDHLRVRFRVLDARHQEVFVTRDTAELAKFLDEYHRLLEEGKPAASHPASAERVVAGDATLWPWGALPESAEVGNAGWTLRNYPALTEEADGAVVLRWYADKAEAAAAHRAGVRRLYVLALGREFGRLATVSRGSFPASRSVLRSFSDLGPSGGRALPDFRASDSRASEDAVLAADAALAAIDGVLLPPTEPVPRDEETFRNRLAERRGSLGLAAREQLQLASGAIALAAERRAALETASLPSETFDDLSEQLDWLVFPGFAKMVSRERLRHYGRYLEAVRLRMERAHQNPARDAERMAVVRGFWVRYTAAVAKQGLTPEEHRALADIRWAIEELRVSLFAQELRTPAPVSAQRIERMFAAVCR